jgi:hypothetical protein
MRRLVSEERGAVLAMFALWLPVFILVTAFVVDVGTWFQHKKHLQMQVDAGALAGGLSYRFPCTGAIDSAIEAKAREYSGDPGSGVYNQQVSPTQPSNMHILINSTAFYNEGGTNGSDGTPCGRGYLDVKGTESNLPWFFGMGSRFVPAINADARVSLQQANSLGGLLPVGVRDVEVKTAAVLFVNDATPAGSPLDAEYLTHTGNTGNMQNWTSSTSKAMVTIAPQTSAIILLSSRASGVSIDQTTMTTAQICNQQQVECYADSGGGTFTPSTGLAFIRGYSTSPVCCTSADVQARAVRFVSGGTCSDPYLVYRPTSPCTVRMRATMDFGPAGYVPVGSIAIRAYKTATNTCQGGSAFTGMTPVSGNTEWQVDLSVAADLGAVPMSLCARVTAGAAGQINGRTCGNGSNACEFIFNNVHQAFSGNDDVSGPIRSVQIWNGDTTGSDCYWATCAVGPGPWANSFVSGTTHSLYVDVKIAGAVSTSVSDDLVALRVAKDTTGGGTGNQVAIDCQQGVNLATEIANGCQPTYQINTRQSQADPCDPPYGGSSTSLWASAQPWECVAIKPGGTIGQFSNGISTRVFGTSNPPGTCPATGARGHNNWSSFPNFPDGDPRIIELFMVPFGSFRDTGADQIFPVVNFGAFYVRDWGGTGNNDDPCGELAGDPIKGYLYGNFIKYIVPSGGGTGGGTPCDPTSFTPCLPVLVK